MKTKNILFLLLALVVIGIAIYFPKLNNLYYVLHLFDEDKIVENFRSFDQKWPASYLSASSDPFIYPRGTQAALPKTFSYNGKDIDTNWFLEGSKTTGLLMIQNDSLIFEEYYLGNTDSTKNISWSVAKSFISALFGIAVDEGYIENLSDDVTKYVPELIGSAYEGVSLKQVLQMSTGVKFNEDYGDLTSDINRWGRAFAMGNSQDEFAATLEREREPGTYNHYVSINTHVLGMILTRATGQSITDYMQEKLWEPVGMEQDAYWIVDGTGMEVALCGLNVTLRDYAKIGSLYLNNGLWRGKTIIAREWIKASTTPDAPHLMPSSNSSSNSLGYGYQWWIPSGNEGEYMAQGVYNQTIYINPTTQTVIVKLSANDKFNDHDYIPSQYRATLALFRAMIASQTASQ